MAKLDLTFHYARREDASVVLVDDDGVEWKMTPSKNAIHLEGSIAHVEIEAEVWKKRVEARSTSARFGRRFRKCLCCSAEFEGDKFTRICQECKEGEEWKFGGGDYALAR